MEKINKRIGIIGGGVIGQSWAALFAVHGGTISVFEPNKDDVKKLRSQIIDIISDMPVKEGAHYGEDRLVIASSIQDAVNQVGAVQEAGPELAETKQSIFRDVKNYAPKDALILSPSSGIVPSKSSANMKNPTRLDVEHPSVQSTACGSSCRANRVLGGRDGGASAAYLRI